MSARALMIGGTASHVGKSWMSTAICRWLARKGVDVAPFKAQNMSNNSYPCCGGGEIGRAQVAQAEACFLEPEADMNPILLKPTSEAGSQLVVNGKVANALTAGVSPETFKYLLGQVLDSYERLANRHDFIVLEGAGSITELNLRSTDLVNLGLATRLRIPLLLVADIDLGGVFASIAGTFILLEEQERSLVRSFAINRFRGDPTLFESGVRILENQTGKPCVGIFPFLPDVALDPEDAVPLEHSKVYDSKIAIVVLPHVANLSDFRLLQSAYRLTRPTDLQFDWIILPGTKNTVGDLCWLRETGLADWVLDQYKRGTKVLGICGGYQMLGQYIEDPFAMESSVHRVEGLGLLEVKTILESQKMTRSVTARTPSGIAFEAYEIHLGQTTRPKGATAFAILSDGSEDGLRTRNCVGTYLHGAIEDHRVLGELLGRSIEPAKPRDVNYETMADWFERNVNRKRFEELYL